jgi:hypothetical protein
MRTNIAVEKLAYPGGSGSIVANDPGADEGMDIGFTITGVWHALIMLLGFTIMRLVL